MNSEENKKVIRTYVESYIMDILKKESSRENPMKIAEITRELNQRIRDEANGEEVKEISRQKVGRILESLVPIPAEELDEEILLPGVHAILIGEDEDGKRSASKRYWLENTLTDNELRHVLDVILFSNILSQEQVMRVISRLRDEYSNDFKTSVNYYSKMKKQPHISGIDTLENVKIIRDAIKDRKRIEFFLNVYKWKYNSDLKKFEISLEKNRESKYVGSPYEIVYNNGRYFMIFANSYQEKNGGYLYFRVDLLSEIIITDQRAASIREAKVYDIDDLYDYRMKHPFCYTGESGRVKFRIETLHFQKVVDQFGTDIKVEKVILGDCDKQEYLDICINVNRTAFTLWAMQYGEYVEVLEPQKYRDEIKKIISKMAIKYDVLTEDEKKVL